MLSLVLFSAASAVGAGPAVPCKTWLDCCGSTWSGKYSLKLDDDLPPFSWARVPTFAHCCNESGLFNDEILRYMSRQSFVVIEKSQGVAESPHKQGAEAKIIAAAKQIKAAAAQAGGVAPDIYMYYQMDYVRTWYDSGAAFDRHPALELQNTSGGLVDFGSWHIYDFANADCQDEWVAAMTGPMNQSDGAIDGFCIDGYQNVRHSIPDHIASP
jgi:hypothetical protein